jgi:hypothetical protein
LAATVEGILAKEILIKVTIEVKTIEKSFNSNCIAGKRVNVPVAGVEL